MTRGPSQFTIRGPERAQPLKVRGAPVDPKGGRRHFLNLNADRLEGISDGGALQRVLRPRIHRDASRLPAPLRRYPSVTSSLNLRVHVDPRQLRAQRWV
jgi:hypothetical protein